MKYLKTYDKLFESRGRMITLKSDEDFNKIDDSVTDLMFYYVPSKWPKIPDHIKEIIICWKKDILNFENLELPKELREFECDHCDLEKLPELPKKFMKLRCHYNQLTKLPKLPRSLKKLECQYNKLTEIPDLPKDIKKCFFYDNPLERLPKGISKELLRENYYVSKDWFKDNMVKWLINEPNDYDLLKEYLTETQRKTFEENGPDGFGSMEQFGMFGLKNDK